MQDGLTLDVLLDMIVFEDLETANEKLAPHNLVAQWTDEVGGEVEIRTTFGGFVCRVGANSIASTPEQGDLFAGDIEATDAAGAALTTAQEDSESEDETFCERGGPYQSKYRGAFAEGDTSWEAQNAELGFRKLLADPNSKLVKLLQFYAHGFMDNCGDVKVPEGQTVKQALSGKVVRLKDIEALIDPATLAQHEVVRNKQHWAAEIAAGMTLLGFEAWMLAKGAEQQQVTEPKAEPYKSPFRHAFAGEEVDVIERIRARYGRTEVKSTSDERTVNNTMRHAYRVLNDDEKAAMQNIKDMGLEFVELLDTLEGSREISIAKTKIEEAVMWAVKSITK